MTESSIISLRRLAGAGGPAVKTMLWRIQAGKYPKAIRQGGEWFLTADDAVKAVVEWMDRKEMMSIADAAALCGLKPTSLNLKAIEKTIKATRIHGRWLVPHEEVERLKEFYVGTVTTSKAAKMLGYAHRRSIHDLIQRGFASVRLGTEYRIRVRDIEDFLRAKAQNRRDE